jgi:hypothetical protein
MRISHTDLEVCVRNPRQWYASTIAAPTHGYKMGYERVLRLSVFHFHKTTAEAARDYLTDMIKKHQLKNTTRVSEIENGLEAYIKWTISERLKVAGTHVRISLALGFLELRGEIGRVDVTDSGYRGVLLSEAVPNWQAQLRMPLIQAAIASLYGRPTERTEVGFQELDGSNLQTVIYASRQITTAQEKFRALGRLMRSIAAPRHKA